VLLLPANAAWNESKTTAGSAARRGHHAQSRRNAWTAPLGSLPILSNAQQAARRSATVAPGRSPQNRASHRIAARSKRSGSACRIATHTERASPRSTRGSSAAAARMSSRLRVASARWNRAYGLPWLVTNTCSHRGPTDHRRAGGAEALGRHAYLGARRQPSVEAGAQLKAASASSLLFRSGLSATSGVR
jgi:hypothetical protein